MRVIDWWYCHHGGTKTHAARATASKAIKIINVRIWKPVGRMSMPHHSWYRVPGSGRSSLFLFSVAIELYGSRGDRYELAKGTHIDLRSSPVWCRQCNGFTDGESIEAPEEIDRQIADLRDPTSELYRFCYPGGTGSIGVDVLQLITKLNKRRRWRESRKSPPKCLGCGSTEIVLLPAGEKVANPAGPGWSREFGRSYESRRNGDRKTKDGTCSEESVAGDSG